jgi:asparagine synthase (glutamine-hydrolysing)
MRNMCGIFGAFHRQGYFTGEDYDRFAKLTDLVHYRGPDATGYACFDLKSGGREPDHQRFDLFLGHVRLSIIDLSPEGNQPLTDGRGLWIVFNGEIFNYIELKKELNKTAGYPFRSGTDTEVILHIYREYGEDGFDRLNGMWAFVIADLNEKKLILSRDRFSIKPLYYAEDNDKFYFASEIKQIIPLIQSPCLNREVMFKFLEQGLLDYDNQTFYQQIYKLPPKSNLVFHGPSYIKKFSKYWDYQLEMVHQKTAISDVIENFRELFIDSVRIRLRSDVTIGGLLSGGLDSSCISLVANEFQQGRFQTYSVISEDERYSERKHIYNVSQAHHIKNHMILLKLTDINIFANYIEEVIYHNDEPFLGFSTVAHYLMLEELKKHSDIVVVLNGQGGDEILMGYIKYFFFYLFKLLMTKKFSQALSLVLSSLFNRTAIWQFNFADGQRYMPFLHHWNPKTFLKLSYPLEPIWFAPELRQRQIMDIDKYSVPALTHYEDRNSMAHTLEIRLPFLDHRLINFTLNLPIELNYQGGWSKYLLRQAMHELPATIRWRRDKQGFVIPEEIWLKYELAPFINSIFKRTVLEEMDIIDSKLFFDYYDKFRKGERFICYSDITRVLAAELWARKFFCGEPIPAISAAVR